jgi:hypothetical protein
MKYLVVKGWLGFGDRLESLKMAVWFAIQHKLQIYVDWTDSIWSHGSESFYTYFKLVNMPVLNSLDDIPADATVYPPYWKDHLKEPLTQEVVNKQKELNLNIGTLNTKIKVDEDVLVFSSIGNRTLFTDSGFFANVFRVIHPEILENLIARQKGLDLSTTIGIHIRGTDRLRNNIRRDQGIQYMAMNAMMNGSFSGKAMVVVSDDAGSIEIWKRFYPLTTVFSKLSLKTTAASRTGIHTTKKEDLPFSKDEMNVEMLTDFFTLALCQRVLSTCKDSRFAQEARRLHLQVNIILGNG